MDPFNHFTNSAVESYRRTQELMAGGAMAAQMRRMKEIATGGAMGRQMQNLKELSAGHMHSVGAVADAGRLFSEGAMVETARRTLDALNLPPRSHATERFTVQVEEERPATTAPQPVTEDRPIDRSFILQQMIEAKDEAAQAACCRYILRNRLLES